MDVYKIYSMDYGIFRWFNLHLYEIDDSGSFNLLQMKIY